MIENRIKKQCKTCKKYFEVKMSRNKTAKYCSFECYDKTGSNNPYWGKHHSEEIINKMKLGWKQILSKGYEPKNKQLIFNRCLICNKRFKVNNTLKNQKCCSIKCTKSYRSLFLTGEKSANWIDGRSYAPYPARFNKKLKEKIKMRDNYVCQLCKLKDELSIHHIDYDKNNNTEDNLITLCLKCNSIANGNRNYWKTFYRNYL
jgi:hypothetical protein